MSLEGEFVKCNKWHRKPERKESKKLFGLITRVALIYPETDSSSCWTKYSGPTNLFFLWLALLGSRIFWGNKRGLTIDREWVFWNRRQIFGFDQFDTFKIREILKRLELKRKAYA